ncbi:hypothetical protein ANN_08173 [Periplaneta americana]|uniref:Uncharacterized protein n=1 Tax=Periplaneta americana TaxID=6978 RepID=A0ABQ8T2A9_PERAM|nr:hypothetical protein ANN_08173 [Periplaneta americana]
MAGFCEGGNEPADSLKTISHLNIIDLGRDRTRNLEHRWPVLYRLRYRDRQKKEYEKNMAVEKVEINKVKKGRLLYQSLTIRYRMPP